jgi:hypothetical protein
MKSYKDLVEYVEMGKLDESLENPETLDNIANKLKKEYGFEVGVSKSSLGGGDPSYFMKVFGPKSTWTNGIALNSPFHIMFSIVGGTIKSVTNSSGIAAAKVKFRATKYKNDADLEKKLLLYFSKNKAAFANILSESVELEEAKSDPVMTKLRDMVNKPVESRLIMVSGGLVSVNKLDASKLVSLYDNQTPAKKKEMEKQLLTKSGFERMTKFVHGNDMNEAKSDFTIAHKTFSSAVQHAWAVTEKRGYEIDEDDWDHKISLGPKKPSSGKTNSYSIGLMKKGKPVKQKLQIQVYYDEGRYELNMYIQ